MTQRRYFNVANKNCRYNESAEMWEIDFPHEFYTSSNPDKKIIILGAFYWGDLNPLDYNEWVSLHSPTIANGKPQELNNYITMCQYPSANWTKEYKIGTYEKTLQFDFRKRSEGYQKRGWAVEIADQFVLELELIY